MSDSKPFGAAADTADDRVRAAVIETLAEIAPEADPASVAPDTNLRREFDLDSIDFQNFLAGLAKRLGRDIPARVAGELVSPAACQAFFHGTGGPGLTGPAPGRS
jgi:acyl carrier protein